MPDVDVPPPEEIILYEKDPDTRIATITLNRPDQLNIPTIGARRRYADLLFKASIDDDVKVLVVRGVGDHLGSGADPDELMAKQREGNALDEEFGLTDDDDVSMPGPRSYRAGGSLLHWYGNTRSGCRSRSPARYGSPSRVNCAREPGYFRKSSMTVSSERSSPSSPLLSSPA